ncbi:ATP-binding protein [Pirellulaceae bacterium SH501]
MNRFLDSLSSLLETQGFPARWNCGTVWHQEPWWGWLHIVSDVVIWMCYFTIPLLMIAFARKKGDVPFPSVFALFASFILLCSVTHLIDAMIFYWPVYRLAGLMKFATAVVSFGTVIALFKILPAALLLRGPNEAQREIDDRTVELRKLTAQLQVEADRREKVVQDLRENRELLKLAMTEGDTGFFNWDLKSDLVSMDTAEVALTGLGESENKIFADDFFERIDPDYQDSVREAAKRAVEFGEPYDVRFPFLRPDGRKIWLAGRGCVFKDNRGNPLKFIGLNQDVTAQVERENQLDLEAERARIASEQKSRFIAQVSHEIRTPLAAMLGCIDSLLLTLEKSDTRDMLGIVRSQGELLQVLVNDVLDLSKMEAGRLKYEAKPTRVANVFADVWSLMNPLAQEKGISIRWLAETKIPETIVCDRYRLKQVFVNLIGNAIKFTDRGAVTIVARLESYGRNQNDLIAEVRDTGCGIPKDKLEVIFEEFEQAGEERSGAGLGLAICRRLVHLMGGTITARSEIGIGSAFTVRIPIGEIDEEALVVMDHIALENNEESVVREEMQRLPLKVLAAEDTRAIQFVLRRMIGSLVSELAIVSNGRLAVEQVMEAEKGARPYDLVLMDIQMPEVDGIEATRQLRREGFKRPIIALTAGAMESEKQACITAGCTHFLAKPIDLRELRRLMQAISEEKK